MVGFTGGSGTKERLFAIENGKCAA